jgi:hypothetical protein
MRKCYSFFFKEDYFKFRIRFINCGKKQWFVVLSIKFYISKKFKIKKMMNKHSSLLQFYNLQLIINH